MTWRVTFNGGESINSLDGVRSNGHIDVGNNIRSNKPIEIRSTFGHIVRLAKGSEFSLIETPVGVRAEYYGETAVVSMAGPDGKYRTSCYMVAFSEQNPSVLIRPGKEEQTDEFLVFIGDISITEYDEDNRQFHICSVCEGEKVVLTYDESKKMRDRYKVSEVKQLTEEDWQYYLENYLNGSKWR